MVDAQLEKVRSVAARQVEQKAPASYLDDFDTQLMLRVREGDDQAAGTLIRRNAERVTRYIARLVRQSRSIEDLVQDVFVRVLHSAAEYRPTARFSTWLYRVATNVALNHLGRADQRLRVSVNEENDLEVVDRRESNPAGIVDRDELRTQVARAIEELPANQRIALTLFQYEDLSYEQIAGVMDVTVEAVRSLLTRARQRLRERLADLMS